LARRCRHRLGECGTIGTTQNIGHLFFLGAAILCLLHVRCVGRALMGFCGRHLGRRFDADYMPPYATWPGAGIFDAR